MTTIGRLAAATALLAAPLTVPLVACAQTVPVPQAATPSDAGPAFADLADLVIAAPIIADITIRSTATIKPAEAPGLQPGFTRYYVTADVVTLVRGTQGIAPRIGYLLDVAPDASGRQPKLKRLRALVFARPVPNAPDQVQLVAPDGQVDWNPVTDQRVRDLARAVLATDAPPRIIGIGNAFHVAGALPGEGETQIFLTTANGAPVSLSILRRPGEERRWAVALSEIVDDAARPPERDTLLWYRLACALPADLPDSATQALQGEDATLAREDYAFVLRALGPCGRTHTVN